MRALVLLLLLLPAASAAQAGLGPRLVPEPLHGSAPLAYAVSAGASAALLGVGYGLTFALPEASPGHLEGPREMAYLVLVSAAYIGPAVGNMSLAAWDDVGTGAIIRAVPLLAGGVLVLTALAVCAPLPGHPITCGNFGEAALGTAVALAVGGAVAGLAYDLVTIPRNAARARERRHGPGDVRVAFVPAPQAAALGLRVRF